MLTAEEARKLTESAIKNRQDKEIILVNEICKNLNDRISEAIKEEKFTVQAMVGQLTQYQSTKLACYYQQLGYDCRVTIQRGDYSCYISWTNSKGMDIGR